MKQTLWLLFVGLPVALVAVVFSIANRHGMTINLWPLERSEELPVFAVILVALVVGFLLGAIVMWLSSATVRDRARRARLQKDDLERELTYVKRQQDKAEGAAPATAQRSLPAA